MARPMDAKKRRETCVFRMPASLQDLDFSRTYAMLDEIPRSAGDTMLRRRMSVRGVRFTA
jgi:hypothetical protein